MPAVRLYNAARAQHVHDVRLHSLGVMDLFCIHCGAYHWKDERSDGTLTRPLFGKCCANGKVVLPNIFEAPATLANLYTGTHIQAQRFRSQIRIFNNAFAFVSMGARRDMSVAGQAGIYTFKVQGQVYHQIGSLLPTANSTPSFAQCYFVDTDAATELNMRLSAAASPTHHETGAIIRTALNWVNPYASFLRYVRPDLEGPLAAGQNVAIQMLQPDPVNGPDPRRYNRPTAAEVAAVVVNLSASSTSGRDIVITYNDGPLRRVNEHHPSFIALRFPLLNPYGHFGWHQQIPLGRDSPQALFSADPDVHQAALEHPDTVFGRGRGGSYRVSLEQFHAYHLHVRPVFSTLLHARTLLQEYVVDAWIVVEANRLSFIRYNQGTIRADLYNGVQDALMNGTDLHRVGTKIILPSSFTGGPRFWQQRFHDAMALVRQFRRADLFLTMTCSPKWPEIQEALGEGQQASDRPDIVSRVFILKLKHVIDLLYRQQVLGKVEAYVYSVEFQKRGLPHAHILLFLADEDKLRTAEAIDRVVSAELPDPELDPELHAAVVRNMIHGPCTSASLCMQDPRTPQQCSKRYPRALREHTDPEVNGYPEYKRRPNGVTVQQTLAGRPTRTIDSTWVVPYNPYLLKTMQCHLNVEVSTSIRAVKYLFKYIFKGPDSVVVAAGMEGEQNEDEIAAYVDARYVSPCEAVFRLLSLSLHGIYPSVKALPLHLPGQHRITFDPADAQGIRMRLEEELERTQLTEFFQLCRSNPAATANLTYDQVPTWYTWGADKTWKRRRNAQKQVGRLYFTPRDNSDRFYLRILLCVVPSPKSFDDLRTVDGVQYDSFRSACTARGLLADDQEWDLCLQEATLIRSGAALRRLFCTIVVNERVDNPERLYASHQDALADDCNFRLNLRGVFNAPWDRCLSYSRFLLRQTLRQMKPDSDIDSYGVPPPAPEHNEDHEHRPVQLLEELQRNPATEAANATASYSQFTDAQKAIFHVLASAADHPAPSTRLFFINGPGGCGKTFVENTLLARVRGQGRIALAVAASGIAALMLDGGRTAHNRFKIPFLLDGDSVCAIRAQSGEAELLRQTSVVIWDEAPMQHRHCFEAVDRLFRDLHGNDLPFGGVMFVFSGDWYQTLPIIKNATTGETVAACLHQSALWKDMTVLHLQQNLRLLRALDHMSPPQANFQAHYAAWVEAMSKGCADKNDLSQLRIPDVLRYNADQPAPLIDFVYGDALTTDEPPAQYWRDRSILHARNVDVDNTNESVLNALPGEPTSLFSADLATTPQGELLPGFASDHLATLRPPGLPPHHLQLKTGVPVMLLRNLDPPAGLCNGTRLIVTHISRRVIEAEIITGSAAHQNTVVLIPRISIRSGDGVFPFTLCRRQFPVKVCFAMTINKSQGQTIQHIGIDLRYPCFGHGQLYVALSRASNAEQVKVLLPEDKETTANVVLHAALPF
ncbi:hypothetical protein A4X13_0g3984 [Tilletia indica]|uniref:ATP-dependent DNA helicase n=1 Tax=Tilletia indica TaxID=43049 RepID=A0A177TFZ3_9BASI|nr:hypothetical protein A4X13_0g3984 [Tilletia indica]